MSVIGTSIREIARRYPERIAIETWREKISYQEFYQSIQLLQRKLTFLFPRGKGKKIGYLLPNEPKWIELFIAISSMGGIAIPFDPKWSPWQLSEVIIDAEPDLVVYDRAFANQFKGINTVKIFTIEALELLSPTGEVASDFSGQDPFYIGYTSGTTGQPKGFIRSHASWADCFSLGRQVFSLTEEDKVLCPGPLVHSHFLYAAVQCLHIGSTLHLCSSFSADEVWELLHTRSITVMYMVPTMFEALTRTRGSEVNNHLTTLISSGAKWPDHSKQKVSKVFPQASVYEFYGASELSFVSYRKVNNESLPEGAIGKPFPGVEVSIFSDKGEPVPQGEVGTLFVKSPWVFNEYVNRPEETAKVFHGDWATVDDLAFCNEEGHIILKGRKQNMIISGGLNIYPEEVEQVIRNHPAIEEAAVLGVEDEYWGQKVVAFITCAEGRKLVMDEMNAYIAEVLPKYKCPKEWIQLQEFSYTGSGKIARKKLQIPARSG